MKRYTLTFAVLIGLLAGCTDKLDFPNPNAYNSENYFSGPNEISQAVTATYAGFYFQGLFQHQWHVVFDGLGNEFDVGPGGTNESDALQAWNYNLRNDNAYLTAMWKSLYRIVLRANLSIDKGNEVYNKTKDPKVARLVGEAKFLRAWAYFQLAFYWGRVPLRSTYDQAGNEDSPRQPVEKIWAQVQSDLEDAQKILPDNYTGSDIGRATKGAATALLAKKYLYAKDYAKADTEFLKLDGKYQLLPGNAWNDNFGETNKNNVEGVFEIQHEWFKNNFPWGTFGDLQESQAGQPSTQTARAQLYGFNDWSNWKMSAQRVSDFIYPDEYGNTYKDPRAAMTFYGDKNIGDTLLCRQCSTGPKVFDYKSKGLYWYKKYTNYQTKQNENTLQTSNNYRLIRYADVLLMRAECKIMQGDVSNGMSLINQVRSRVGAFTYKGTYSKDQAFELLKRERVLELIGEEQRYNDLKRWGIAKQVLNAELIQRGRPAAFEDKHILLPIPLEEINNNAALKGDIANNWN